jgi:hypothetical protein
MDEIFHREFCTGKHVIFNLNHKKFLNMKNIPTKLRDFIGDNKITYHKLALQKTVYVPTGPLSCHFGIAYRKEARIVVDGALKAEVREPPGPVRALHLTSYLVVGE